MSPIMNIDQNARMLKHYEKNIPLPPKLFLTKNHRTDQKTKQNIDLTMSTMLFLPALMVQNLKGKYFVINISSGNIKFTTSHKSYPLMHSYPHDSSHALPRHHPFQSTVNRSTNLKFNKSKPQLTDMLYTHNTQLPIFMHG